MTPLSPPRVAVPLPALTEVDVVSANEVVGVKRIEATDPYLSGHYPGFPIYPGVFVVESARQAVAELVKSLRGKDFTVDLAGVPSVRFTAPLLPGDVLRVHARCEVDADTVTASVRCTGRDGQPVAQLSLRLTTTRVRAGLEPVSGGSRS